MRLPAWRYEKIKKIATNNLICYSDTIPVDVFELARINRLILMPYSKLTAYELNKLQNKYNAISKDGFLFWGKKRGKLRGFIYYDDFLNPQRVRFTIMHEIGHYLLKHYEISDLAEAEANFFAKFLLAPPILVHLIKPTDYMEIAETFDVSHEFAYNAFVYYQKWLNTKRRNNKIEDYESSLYLKFKNNFSLIKAI